MYIYGLYFNETIFIGPLVAMCYLPQHAYSWEGRMTSGNSRHPNKTLIPLPVNVKCNSGALE